MIIRPYILLIFLFMKIIVYWNDEKAIELYNKVTLALEELWLSDFIDLEKSFDEELKTKLDISKTPSLIVEEENIDFIDVIFSWIVPSDEEIKSVIVGIIWGSETPSCATAECGVTCMN
jgi:hypothetical protein